MYLMELNPAVAKIRSADPPRIAIRAFKRERQLEVWGAKSEAGPYEMLGSYRIAAISGGLGPKLRAGDLQAPEGFYRIDRFNPHSRFHLSLGINYPNAADRKRRNQGDLGKDIFIHGGRKSAGCLAMTDAVIEIIYRQGTHARNAGQRHIPVTIFPCRLDAQRWKSLRQEFTNRPDLIRFWSTLRPGYLSFEKTHQWPSPHLNSAGDYVWPALGRTQPF